LTIQLGLDLVALLLPVVQEADVIQEHLVLLGALDHEVAHEIGRIRCHADHRFIHDHLEVPRTGYHHGVNTGFVSLLVLEDNAALGISQRGVRVVQLVPVVIGQVDGVLLGSGDGHLDVPHGILCISEGYAEKEREEGGQRSTHGCKSNGVSEEQNLFQLRTFRWYARVGRLVG